MRRYYDFRRGEKTAGSSPRATPIAADEPSDRVAMTALTKSGESMKLIPWEDIWTSLRVARIRGNGDMIDVFYDTLFREAIFDDDGAWAFNQKKRF